MAARKSKADAAEAADTLDVGPEPEPVTLAELPEHTPGPVALVRGGGVSSVILETGTVYEWSDPDEWVRVAGQDVETVMAALDSTEDRPLILLVDDASAAELAPEPVVELGPDTLPAEVGATDAEPPSSRVIPVQRIRADVTDTDAEPPSPDVLPVTELRTTRKVRGEAVLSAEVDGPHRLRARPGPDPEPEPEVELGPELLDGRLRDDEGRFAELPEPEPAEPEVVGPDVLAADVTDTEAPGPSGTVDGPDQIEAATEAEPILVVEGDVK